MIKALFSVIAISLLVCAVLTVAAASLNHLFGWSLGLGIGGFDIELMPDFWGNVMLAVALLVMAGVFEFLSKPGKVWGWVKRHKSATAGGLVALGGALFFGVMQLAGGPLGFAVEAGDTGKVVKILAENNYSSDTLNPHFYQALKQGRIDMAEALHQAGAEANHVSGEFDTPLLSSAITWFPAESVKALIEWKADPNKVDSMGRTPAMILVLYRSGNFPQESPETRVELLKALVAAGADLSTVSGDGKSVLELARDNGRDEAVLRFLEGGSPE